MENQLTQKKEILWINCAKFIAIFAVILDHTTGIIHWSSEISYASFFSVTLFVFLSGMTSYKSVQRNINKPFFLEFVRRCKPVIIAYLVGTAAYLCASNGYFSLDLYIEAVWNFSAAPQFYFIWFYIQLIFVAPFLYKLIIYFGDKRKKNDISIPSFMHYVMLVLTVVIAYISIKYTVTKELYGGGRYLFGGTYFIFFYLGMLFSYTNFSLKSRKILTAGIVIFSALLFVWMRFYLSDVFTLDTHFPFGNGRNPPGITLGIYTVLIAGLLFCFFSLLERSQNKVVNHIVRFISMMGKYSLDIFIYHMLIMSILNPMLSGWSLAERAPVYIILLIGLPIIGRKAYNLFSKIVGKRINNC